MSSSEPLKAAQIKRLVRYCHYLQARHQFECLRTVSSIEIADYTDVDESQVRKDLAMLDVKGTPRVGYQTPQVIEAIHERLGFNHELRTIIVGAGRFGSALACYPGFSHYGLRVVAIFDSDPDLVNTAVADHVVEPMSRLNRVVREADVQMAILTVPAEAASDCANRLAIAGVKAIWNFAPSRFSPPAGVRVHHQHLSAGLAELAYFLKKRPDKVPE